ncbi:MAG: type 1 glutamine amidotransferase [bacterium]|nr:type 1 glutamine amidotransferase [bacterium]
MTDVLFLLHTATEGPGTIAPFVAARGARAHYACLYAGAGLPADPRHYDLIVAMGGPMNVDEEEHYPFLREETAFLRTAIAAKVPVLGVCLGAQLIAKACGARVAKAPRPEIGWYPITLCNAAANDPAFAGLPAECTVLHWHEDMALLPEGAVLLASSADCPHQAFRVGSALALQFHVEITLAMLAAWTADKPALQHIAADHTRHAPALDSYATRLYANLWQSFHTH